MVERFSVLMFYTLAMASGGGGGGRVLPWRRLDDLCALTLFETQIALRGGCLRHRRRATLVLAVGLRAGRWEWTRRGADGGAVYVFEGGSELQRANEDGVRKGVLRQGMDKRMNISNARSGRVRSPGRLRSLQRPLFPVVVSDGVVGDGSAVRRLTRGVACRG